MKFVIVILLVVTALAGVFSLAAPGFCPIAAVLGIVFFLLAARQSRKDRESREERLWRQRQQ